MIAVSAKILAACAAGTLVLAPVAMHPKVQRAVKHHVAKTARKVAQAVEPVPCIPVGAAPVLGNAPIVSEPKPVPERFLPEWSTEAPQPEYFGPTINYWPPEGGGGWYPPVIIPVDPDKPIPGVPEPQSWVLMITGFFAVGYTMRRKNYIYAI